MTFSNQNLTFSKKIWHFQKKIWLFHKKFDIFIKKFDIFKKKFTVFKFWWLLGHILYSCAHNHNLCRSYEMLQLVVEELVDRNKLNSYDVVIIWYGWFYEETCMFSASFLYKLKVVFDMNFVFWLFFIVVEFNLQSLGLKHQ